MSNTVQQVTHLSEIGEALHETKIGGREDQTGMPTGDPLENWYAVQTYPRHEKRVHADLALRSIESFLPLYATVNRWKNGCKMRVELPLFPGYLFVKIDPRARFKILSLPGAVSIVGSSTGPWALPETEIANLRVSMQTLKVEPHEYLAVGQQVRITHGALANMTGFLVRKAGGLRVVLSIEMIRRSASVEVDANDVEAIDPAPAGLVA
jgi:transcription antitermination factor NusG